MGILIDGAVEFDQENSYRLTLVLTMGSESYTIHETTEARSGDPNYHYYSSGTYGYFSVVRDRDGKWLNHDRQWEGERTRANLFASLASALMACQESAGRRDLQGLREDDYYLALPRNDNTYDVLTHHKARPTDPSDYEPTMVVVQVRNMGGILIGCHVVWDARNSSWATPVNGQRPRHIYAGEQEAGT